MTPDYQFKAYKLSALGIWGNFPILLPVQEPSQVQALGA